MTTMESVRFCSKAKENAKARAHEIVTTAVHQAISPESAPALKKANATPREASKENATTAEKWVTQQGSARKEKKERRPVMRPTTRY